MEESPSYQAQTLTDLLKFGIRKMGDGRESLIPGPNQTQVLENSCTPLMGKRTPGNTGESSGVKGKKVRTTSDESGGKSVSEKSESKV